MAAAAGIGTMTAALERGDLDETSRQGMLAGPVVVERALADPARSVRLAAIASAPHVEARAELLPALADAARAPDRRTAIPAARAARAIARGLAARELPDDLGPDDVAVWRAHYEAIAAERARFVEVRVLALDTASALARAIDAAGVGFDLAAMLDDPDPAVRGIAVALVPRPTPSALHAPLAAAVIGDADDRVALGAAHALCGDDPAAAIPLLGAQGLDRIARLVGAVPRPALRDAARCVKR